jgi:hypothetical protein
MDESRMASLLESVMEAGYGGELAVSVGEAALAEFLGDVGFDTRKFRAGYIASQIGFSELLSESGGGPTYILERFTLDGFIGKIKSGLGRADEYLAGKARKFIANNISHSYMQNRAARVMNSIYDNEPKWRIAWADRRLASLERLRQKSPDNGIGNTIDREESDVRMARLDATSDKARREAYKIGTGGLKPLEVILKTPRQPGESDLQFRARTLTSGLLPSQEYTNMVRNRTRSNMGTNATIIDRNTGERRPVRGKELGVSNASSSSVPFLTEPAGQRVFVRNIDRPYRPLSRGRDAFGRADSLGNVWGDISRMTSTYAHELKHAEDLETLGTVDYQQRANNPGVDYTNDPNEISARRYGDLVGDRMRFSFIPAVLKGTAENIYKKLTGRGTGSRGETPADSFQSLIKDNTQQPEGS